MKQLASRGLTLLIFLLPMTLAAHLAAQAPLPLGGVFEVSSSAAIQARNNADVAMDADGNFIVVWHSDVSVGDDTDLQSIQARRFACDGVPIGDDFQVNTYTPGAQVLAQVAMGPAGEFIVSWAITGVDQRARSYASDGTPLGSEFVLSGVTAGALMARDVSGNLMFTENGSDSDGLGVVARRFASDGTSLGGSFQVNTYTTGDQQAPVIGANRAGDGFTVVWYSNPPGGARAQRLDSGGLPLGSEVAVSDAAGLIFAADRNVTMTATGEFAATWNDIFATGNPIRSRRFASDGTPIGASFLISDSLQGSASSLDTAIDDAGNFLVVWEDIRTVDRTIWSRFVAADDALSEPFVVAEDGPSINNIVGTPAVAASPAGHFIIAWQNFIVIGETHIQARLYPGGSHFGDRVWFDADFDGVQDPNEPGVAGVRVNALDGIGDLKHSVLSDASGDWGVFSPNDTTLEFVLPAIYEWTLQDQGGDDTLDSDVDPLTGTAAAGVAVCGDPEDTTIDAGVTNGIGEFAFQDLDADGVQDPGEPGLAGVVVRLLDAGTDLPVTNPFTTKDDGRYHFNYIAAGDYYLEFTPPEDYEFTAQDQGGDDALDSDVDPATGRTASFTLTVLDTTRDAGFVTVNPITRIGDRVWLDDGDGLQAGGEQGVESVTVNLYDSGDTFISSAQTDASGNYSFDVTPGDYYVEVVLPTDMAFAPRDQGGDDAIDSDLFAATGTTAVFNVGLGVTDSSRDAGIEPATIGNRVWADANGDGRQQPDEAGAPNVLVRLLDDAGMVVASTTTDADGIYGFLGVASGDYRIEVVAPSGTGFTTQDVGGDDLIDSDVDPTTGRTTLFTYTAGGASRSHDAGLMVLFADGFESSDVSAWSTVVF